MPSIAKAKSGLQIAKNGKMKPLSPNCSKMLVIPININHTPTAYPTVTAFPFLLNEGAKGAVNKVIIKGKKGVVCFFSNAIA